MDSPVSTLGNFNKFGLTEPLKAAIHKMGFEVPTPIQNKSMPAALKGSDILGCAGTGTGKTAAFGIPLVNQLVKDPKQGAIVIAPTRELATQISVVLHSLTRFTKRPHLRPVLIIGGESMERQIRGLQRNPRIIVGTPGRMYDHLQTRKMKLESFGILVLDEADRMLDMGFEPQIKRIISHMPKKRQTHLFSATIPKEIRKLAASYQSDPEFIDVRDRKVEEKTSAAISQKVIRVSPKDKRDKLLDELIAREGTVIIFVGTKRRTDQIAKYLGSYGHSIGVLHGGRSQSQRNRAIKDFRNGRSRILVATDVASRGIDVPHVAHVINYDLPQNAGDYVHRIGRTGRAGASGETTCFVEKEDLAMWRGIVRLGIGAPPLQSEPGEFRSTIRSTKRVTDAEKSFERRNKRPYRAGDKRKGRRPSKPQTREMKSGSRDARSDESRKTDSRRPDSRRSESRGTDSRRSEFPRTNSRRSDSRRPDSHNSDSRKTESKSGETRKFSAAKKMSGKKSSSKKKTTKFTGPKKKGPKKIRKFGKK